MKKAIDFIRKYRSFIVAAHQNPEGDAIGSTLGMVHILRAAGKKAAAFNQDPVPPVLRFLPGAGEIISRVEDLPPAEAAIFLDSGDIDRAGEPFKQKAEKLPVLNLDHHQTNTRFGTVNWVEPERSSAGEMVAELAFAMKAPLGRDAALCLYLAILTDTGSFQFPNTSPRALEIAARLIKLGADPRLCAEKYYHAKPASHLLLASKALATLWFNQERTAADLHISRQMFKQTGTGPEAAEGLINLLTDVETVLVAALYREQGRGQWKVSLRSKGEIDVAALASRRGGGGHKNAAGFSLSGPLSKVKEQVRKEIQALLRTAGGRNPSS